MHFVPYEGKDFRAIKLGGKALICAKRPKPNVIGEIPINPTRRKNPVGACDGLCFYKKHNRSVLTGVAYAKTDTGEYLRVYNMAPLIAAIALVIILAVVLLWQSIASKPKPEVTPAPSSSVSSSSGKVTSGGGDVKDGDLRVVASSSEVSSEKPKVPEKVVTDAQLADQLKDKSGKDFVFQVNQTPVLRNGEINIRFVNKSSNGSKAMISLIVDSKVIYTSSTIKPGQYVELAKADPTVHVSSGAVKSALAISILDDDNRIYSTVNMSNIALTVK